MSKKVLVLYPKDNYLIALKKSNVTPVIAPAEDADGLLLTGGGDLKGCSYGMSDDNCRNTDLLRDQTEFFYLKKYLSRNKPVFGICRGMQVVNVFLGGTLTQNMENHNQINDKDRKHLIINAENSIFYKIFGKSVVVNSAHHQAVKTLGKNLKASSIALDGIIESATYKNIVLTQFHPERLGITGQKLFRYFAEIL